MDTIIASTGAPNLGLHTSSVQAALRGGVPIAYGAVLVSAIVLVGFAIMLWLVIREEVPPNQRDMVTLLLGTLAGMASSVGDYGVGSSNGSMQKNAAIERAIARK